MSLPYASFWIMYGPVATWWLPYVDGVLASYFSAYSSGTGVGRGSASACGHDRRPSALVSLKTIVVVVGGLDARDRSLSPSWPPTSAPWMSPK